MTEQTKARIDEAKKIIRMASEMSQHFYQKPIIICYSGGKDSDCILRLAIECLEPSQFEVLHAVTTVDSYVTNRYVNSIFKELESKGITANKTIPIDDNGQPTNMWKLIIQEGTPPTRLMRYCCRILKETSTPNRVAILGVRNSESAGRKGRDVFGIRGEKKDKAQYWSLDHTEEVYQEALEKEKEPGGEIWDCTLIKNMREKKDTIANPIYDWTDNDVWDYLKGNNYPYNPMYDMGYHRVGCIGCPMATYRQKMKEFADFPYVKQLYIDAFQKMKDARLAQGKTHKYDSIWSDGEAIYKWWIQEDKHVTKGQITLTSYLEDEMGLIIREPNKNDK